METHFINKSKKNKNRVELYQYVRCEFKLVLFQNMFQSLFMLLFAFLIFTSTQMAYTRVWTPAKLINSTRYKSVWNLLTGMRKFYTIIWFPHSTLVWKFYTSNSIIKKSLNSPSFIKYAKTKFGVISLK